MFLCVPVSDSAQPKFGTVILAFVMLALGFLWHVEHFSNLSTTLDI